MIHEVLSLVPDTDLTFNKCGFWSTVVTICYVLLLDHDVAVPWRA